MPFLSLLRRLHKWVGLVLGVQLLLWTASGTAMALLDHHEVSGGHVSREPETKDVVQPVSLSAVQASLPGAEILGLTIRPMLDGHVYEVKTVDGVRLLDSRNGRPITVDAELAKAVARAEYAGPGAIRSAVRLTEPTLEARGRAGPLWRIDFDDERGSTFYVAEDTGQVVERRTDAWRVWDVFWMLHIMDYSGRESFNHPLVVTAATGAVWLALTGLVLLFFSFRRMDFAWILDVGERFRRPGKR